MNISNTKYIQNIMVELDGTLPNSRAEANAFNIELSFLRNKLVMIPRTALLMISITTKGLQMEARDDEENALIRSPWKYF